MTVWNTFVLLALIFYTILPTYAAEIEPAGTPLRKLQRGFLNIALSPAEIVYEMHNVRKVDSFIPSWGAGLGKGFIYTAGRALAGLYDIATFPVPVPHHYEPLVYPEFAWGHFDKAKS